MMYVKGLVPSLVETLKKQLAHTQHLLCDRQFSQIATPPCKRTEQTWLFSHLQDEDLCYNKRIRREKKRFLAVAIG